MCKKTIYYLIMYLAVMVLAGCGGVSIGEKLRMNIPRGMRILKLNGMTPVKNKGSGRACWDYDMIADIERTDMSMGE